MNITDSVTECIGCGACIDICPVKAIGFQKGKTGHLMAVVDDDTCINCSVCTQMCPTIHYKNDALIDPAFFYGWSADDDTRMSSTSGGAFSALAHIVLQNGGTVFGARYTEDKKGVVMASTDECSVEELKGTKYCQADPDHVYHKIKAALKKGPTMVVGTPCFITAVRNYFGANENLLLVDFMCGGVAPSSYFCEYINYLEKKYGSSAVSVNMRDKTKNWNEPSMRITFSDGQCYFRNYRYDLFLYYYYTPFLKTDLCMHCTYTQHNAADITIGDYWGYRKNQINNDGKGISLVCANTGLGKKAIEEITAAMEIKKLSKDMVEYAYKEKTHSDSILEKRKTYIDELQNASFVEFARNHEFKFGIIGAFARKTMRKMKINL